MALASMSGSLKKKETGLMGNVDEGLVKEVIINIPKNCDKKKSKEYRKVYDRGKCLKFSPIVINSSLPQIRGNHIYPFIIGCLQEHMSQTFFDIWLGSCYLNL